jgi:hypothetical protein
MDIKNCLFFYDTEIVPGTAAPVAVPLTDSLGDMVTDGSGNVVTGKAYALCTSHLFNVLSFAGLGSILCKITICAHFRITPWHTRDYRCPCNWTRRCNVC